MDTRSADPTLMEDATEGAEQQAPYEFSIDLASDNTHASVVRMVGESRRVLELGPATGYMTKLLQQRGCAVVGIELDPEMARQAARFSERVIVGNLDSLDLADELGEDRFDVIVAADVLEHLKDPLDGLRRLRAFLSPGGCFVVSLPNVAHASVRLSLLQGRFEYRDLGLLDRTHLRFFTHETIRQLFDEAELALVEVHRQEAPLAVTDAEVDIEAVPPELIEQLQADPDARTYQFVVKAVPLELPGLRELQGRLHDQALAKDETERELAHLRQQVTPRIEELEQALAAISGREGEVRTALVEAHDQILRRDEEIERLKSELGDLHEQLVRLDRQREHDTAQLAARDEQIRRLRVRLERILNSPPGRLYARIRQLPLLSWVAARRTRGYEQTVRSAESDDE